MDLGKSSVGKKKPSEVIQVQVVGGDSEGKWQWMILEFRAVFPGVN